MNDFLGASIKDARTKSRKIDTFSSFSVRTHHKFRKIRSFLHQKVRTSASEEPPLVRKCPHWTNFHSSLTVDVFNGQPLIVWCYPTLSDK